MVVRRCSGGAVESGRRVGRKGGREGGEGGREGGVGGREWRDGRREGRGEVREGRGMGREGQREGRSAQRNVAFSTHPRGRARVRYTCAFRPQIPSSLRLAGPASPERPGSCTSGTKESNAASSSS